MSTVRVDVTGPGQALIACGAHQARVGRCDGRLYIEDIDSEAIIGRAATYRQAGQVYRKHLGLPAETPIEVDHE